ncbi:MAG: GrdX protein [Clostridiales bacterium]|nr:GrdX protein [Clostridiales bacterium]
MIIITNNDKVYEKFSERYKVVLIDGTYKDVLIKVRDMIHLGHKLLTHPLMGSVKPNETPYRSIAIADQIDRVDTGDIIIIEESIMTFDKFAKVDRPNRGQDATTTMKVDYAEIDLSLIGNAIDR